MKYGVFQVNLQVNSHGDIPVVPGDQYSIKMFNDFKAFSAERHNSAVRLTKYLQPVFLID